MAQLDFTRNAADGACSVFEQHLLLHWRHQAEQGARLQAPDFLFRSFQILSICFVNQFYLKNQFDRSIVCAYIEVPTTFINTF